MPAAPRFQIRRRDRIVFLGDSITEQQLYTNYVENYLASRFPELQLTFFNAGWSGDTAPGGLERLERDVLSLQPNLVTICYGMNDGNSPDPAGKVAPQFVKGMTGLIQRLRQAKVRIVLLTPGYVDESRNEILRQAGYNRGKLRLLAGVVLKLAKKEKLPVFDIYTLMNEVNKKGLAADPSFSLAPDDGVHPTPPGHLVMAYGLLKALGVPPRREQMVLNVKTGRMKSAPGVTVKKCLPVANGCTVEMVLSQLPFFVEPAARKVLPFLPFQKEFNSLIFRLQGLPPARGYYFRSQLLKGSTLTTQQLAGGINLFDHWGLAPMEAAGRIHRFTLEKDQVFFKAWRNLGLDGGNSTYYQAQAHLGGARLTEQLDRVRDRLTDAKSVSFRLNVFSSELAGDPVCDGDLIPYWSVRGPFFQPSATDALGGEAAFTAGLPSLNADWLTPELDFSVPGNCLGVLFGQHEDCFAYAVTVIESPGEQTAQLLLGSDDGIAAFLNGECVHSNLEVRRGLAMDQDRASVRLRKGRNTLLLKISQGVGDWGFCARLSGHGTPVTAMRSQEAAG